MRQILGTLFSVLFLTAPSISHAALRVVTTTQDLAALTEAVGGNQVTVESLTLGTRDPHFAVAKPSMIRKVFRADLLLIVGADMEIGWLPPLLQSSRNSNTLPGNPGYLDLSTTVPLLGKQVASVSRALGDVHAKGNPHYWLDPRNGVRMAQAIATRLGELDPSHAVDYQRRFERFAKAMEVKQSEWRVRLAYLEGRPVIAYHKSFDYLADFFGFRIVGEVEPKPGIAPSASSLSRLITRIKQEQTRVLIMEPYYERRSARYLSEQTGINVAVLPQSVGSADDITTYFVLFDRIVEALEEAVED
ncbi:zinc ABC transporter substrate-binding protein [Rhodospirillaceae bacterium AH-315-P19]|nr:zinc ABC transporter substrate-binding protein [Rhodospirillaceae bacterium AH-315-P19]